MKHGWRAASIWVAMSASRNATAWCSKIGTSKATLSLAYFTAASSAARAMPTDCAAMPIRPASRLDSAIL